MSKRRGVFQVHLLTAIVLLFVAGGLFWMNRAGGQKFTIVKDYVLLPGNNQFDPVIEQHNGGWPFRYQSVGEDSHKTFVSPMGNNTLSAPVQAMQIHWPQVWATAGLGFGILAIVAAACEFVLRMRKRQGFFQIHLMTAIVLMLAAGGLIGLNVGTIEDVRVDYEISGSKATPIERATRIWGWPLRAVELEHQHSSSTGLMSKLMAAGLDICHYDTQRPVFSWVNLWTDAGVALFGLFGLTIVAEWLSRRKQRPA